MIKDAHPFPCSNCKLVTPHIELKRFDTEDVAEAPEEVWLAGKSSCENINFVCIFCKISFCNIGKTFRIRPIVFKDFLTKLIPFAMKFILPYTKDRVPIESTSIGGWGCDLNVVQLL